MLTININALLSMYIFGTMLAMIELGSIWHAPLLCSRVLRK